MAGLADLYEWSDAKRSANLAKHGVDFAAILDFDWTKASVVADARRDYGEARLIAFGRIDGRLHVLVFTRRRVKVRIISLRKANKAEVAFHERS